MEAPGNVGGSQRKKAPIRGNSPGTDGSTLGARRIAPTSGMQTGCTYILALEAPRNDDGSTLHVGRRPVKDASPGADASTVGARRMAPISGMQTGHTYILALEAPRNDDGSTSRAGRRDPIRGASPGADASTVGARRMAPISGLNRTSCFPDVVSINADEVIVLSYVDDNLDEQDGN